LTVDYKTITVDKNFEAVNEKIRPVPREQTQLREFDEFHERLRVEKQPQYVERVEVRTVEEAKITPHVTQVVKRVPKIVKKVVEVEVIKRIETIKPVFINKPISKTAVRFVESILDLPVEIVNCHE